MNNKLPAKLKHKKETYRMQKRVQATQEHKGIVQECEDVVRKVKAQLKLNLARVLKGDRKGFCKYLSGKTVENVGSLLNGEDDLVTQVLNAFFASYFISKNGLQRTQTMTVRGKVWSNVDFPLM